MPQSQRKSVRFVDASAIPRTPSPSSSTASFGSSPGPWTPPQLPHQPLPFITMRAEYPPWTSHQHYPSPPVVPVHISPPKTYSALRSAPELVLDPLLRPSTITLGGIPNSRSRSTLTTADLASPAARHGPRGSRPRSRSGEWSCLPGLPLSVHSPPPRPTWTSYPLDFLTVGDVLDQLHRELRTSLPTREYGALPPHVRRQADKAFEMRHGAIRDRRERERDRGFGVRKVDLLGDVRAFVGLRPATPREVPLGMAPDEVFVVVMETLR
ncbi:uncharacterized protein BXZ73DRAFT_103863 [Epithele typhae]|uniref:uncharacterized protein n=1 Tax=Epithele typhae TaxID=378194 RepID=UPI0020080382|nr:uncharacterized protein BXZ73DRAFT_103863 [Epithele typhae]KAH9923424.1 hypothetical protein BXZ73DRAFT_103863 [Epithele typhae]